MPHNDERDGEPEEGDLVIELGEDRVPTVVTQPASSEADKTPTSASPRAPRRTGPPPGK
jgi:hypothetical protein